MKLTKYEHACVVLEDQGQKLVIDPGMFSPDFNDLRDITALVITHQHGDHFDLRNIENIVAANPGVKIFAPEDVAMQLNGKPVTTVTGGDQSEAGLFHLRFYGQKHAEIYPGHIEVPMNIGVLVNGNVYYPGDSFTKPDLQVHTLLAPVSAPWLKIGETMDFVETLKPKMCVPTHDGLQNEAGEQITNNLLRSISDKHGVQFKYLSRGESLDV